MTKRVQAKSLQGACSLYARPGCAHSEMPLLWESIHAGRLRSSRSAGIIRGAVSVGRRALWRDRRSTWPWRRI